MTVPSRFSRTAGPGFHQRVAAGIGRRDAHADQPASFALRPGLGVAFVPAETILARFGTQALDQIALGKRTPGRRDRPGVSPITRNGINAELFGHFIHGAISRSSLGVSAGRAWHCLLANPGWPGRMAARRGYPLRLPETGSVARPFSIPPPARSPGPASWAMALILPSLSVPIPDALDDAGRRVLFNTGGRASNLHRSAGQLAPVRQ